MFFYWEKTHSEENPQFSRTNLGEWNAQIKCKNESVCTWEMDLQSDKTKRNIDKEKKGVKKFFVTEKFFTLVVCSWNRCQCQWQSEYER